MKVENFLSKTDNFTVDEMIMNESTINTLTNYIKDSEIFKISGITISKNNFVPENNILLRTREGIKIIKLKEEENVKVSI